MISDHWRSLTRRSFKEILSYIAVSALIIAIIFGMFAAGLSWDAFAKWVCLAIFTSVVFGYFVSDSRSLWRTKSFWAYTATCLFLHCAAWAAIVVRVEHWKAIWFTPMTLEVVILVVVRELTLPKSHRKTMRS